MANGIIPLAATPGQVVTAGKKVSPGGDQGATGAAGPPGGLGEAPIDGQTYGRKSSAWQVIPGGGNVVNSGTPTVGQVALWTNATTIQGSASWSNGWVSGTAQLGGSAAGHWDIVYTAPFINMQPGGTDADVYVQQSAKGTGNISFYTAAFTRNQLSIENFASGGKYIGIHGGAGITDNIHLSDNSPIGIWNANLTGAPVAVTPAAGDNSTAVATTAFVQAVAAAMFTTGDAKLTLKTIADPGWLMMNDGTIGSASSGATYANANAQALFNLLFANINDANAPIQTSAGAATTRAAQGTAAAAWAANCRMSLTKQCGRALAVSGSGAFLTSRALGATVGEEAHAQTIAEMAQHNHVANTLYAYPLFWNTIYFDGGTSYVAFAYGGGVASSTGVVVNNTGSGSPANVMQPTSFWNVMIKL